MAHWHPKSRPARCWLVRRGERCWSVRVAVHLRGRAHDWGQRMLQQGVHVQEGHQLGQPGSWAGPFAVPGEGLQQGAAVHWSRRAAGHSGRR
eukprot:8411484-Alexandrium_andersonii.AAC.1